MPTHQIHPLTGETYFVTFTCHKWLPLFDQTKCYDHFYKWFEYLKRHDAHILAYVIMPNHFHGLIHLEGHCSKSINLIISNAKRFLAYEIVKRLEDDNQLDILKILKDDVPEKERLKGKKHQVFRPSFDAKLCNNIEVLETKLDYIHANPVSGKWTLVEDLTEFPSSSAGFYDQQKENKWLTHYKEIWE